MKRVLALFLVLVGCQSARGFFTFPLPNGAYLIEFEPQDSWDPKEVLNAFNHHAARLAIEKGQRYFVVENLTFGDEPIQTSSTQRGATVVSRGTPSRQGISTTGTTGTVGGEEVADARDHRQRSGTVMTANRKARGVVRLYLEKPVNNEARDSREILD